MKICGIFEVARPMVDLRVLKGFELENFIRYYLQKWAFSLGEICPLVVSTYRTPWMLFLNVPSGPDFLCRRP